MMLGVETALSCGLSGAGWAGCSLILAVMLGFAAILIGWRGPIASFYTDDAALLAVVLPTMLVVAVMLPTDGLQGVLMGALRGTGDVWVPTALHLFSFIVVMAPLAAWFALGLDWGVPGLFGGAICGVTTAAILLTLRFRVVARRVIRRL